MISDDEGRPAGDWGKSVIYMSWEEANVWLTPKGKRTAARTVNNHMLTDYQNVLWGGSTRLLLGAFEIATVARLCLLLPQLIIVRLPNEILDKLRYMNRNQYNRVNEVAWYKA